MSSTLTFTPRWGRNLEHIDPTAYAKLLAIFEAYKMTPVQYRLNYRQLAALTNAEFKTRFNKQSMERLLKERIIV